MAHKVSTIALKCDVFVTKFMRNAKQKFANNALLLIKRLHIT